MLGAGPSERSAGVGGAAVAGGGGAVVSGGRGLQSFTFRLNLIAFRGILVRLGVT